MHDFELFHSILPSATAWEVSGNAELAIKICSSRFSRIIAWTWSFSLSLNQCSSCWERNQTRCRKCMFFTESQQSCWCGDLSRRQMTWPKFSSSSPTRLVMWRVSFTIFWAISVISQDCTCSWSKWSRCSSSCSWFNLASSSCTQPLQCPTLAVMSQRFTTSSSSTQFCSSGFTWSSTSRHSTRRRLTRSRFIKSFIEWTNKRRAKRTWNLYSSFLRTSLRFLLSQ